MAGAVSAGAYTAGALDYLIEALEEWQKRKDSHEPNTPNHRVEIPIIGGASAGGMTGAIAAAALQDKIDPVRSCSSDMMAPNPNNKFYHSWVDLISNDMLPALLDTSDISKNGLQSVLNATFIDRIADRAFKVSEAPKIHRKYIPDNLKVFVTLSNLQGMHFSLTFKSNSPKFDRYVVRSHNDYACFQLCNSENDYANDGWIPLNFKTNLNIDTIRNAAMATGAFPVGLKARKLSRGRKYMNDLDWFKAITSDAQNPFTQDPYNTVNVDGGMINNEPFDKIRAELIGETNQNELKDIHSYDKFKSTILMIDPFPCEPPDKFNSGTALNTIIGNTLNAILDQARIKQSTLIDAMNSQKAGQYLIAPVRYRQERGEKVQIDGDMAIACGALNGFGGFISKEFRIHDYFLGRANCEIFLRDYFTVPANTKNEIFVNGYSGIANRTAFSSIKDGSLQIIPIFSKRQDKPYIPVFSNTKEWPTVTYDQMKSTGKMLRRRVEKILFNIADYSRLEHALLWVGAKILINKKIAKSAVNTVVASLENHKLIQ